MNVFSEREQKIIKIIGRKKITLSDISTELFKDGCKPFDTDISVANSVRRIIKKCSFHALDWTLTKSRENNRLYIKKESI